MIALRVCIAGLRQVLRSPALLLVLWILVVVVSLPAVAMIESVLVDRIGNSKMAEDLRGDLDLGWLEEIVAGAEEVSASITPVRLSAAAVLANDELWFSGEWLNQHRGLVGLGILFIAVWIFMLGGVLDHLVARRDRVKPTVFFAACGGFFGRFLRLAVLAGTAYYGVYALSRRLFPWIQRTSRDLPSERSELLRYLAGVLIVVLLLAFVRLVSDFAKISLVMNGRKSAVLAAVEAIFQVIRHPIQTFGIQLFIVLGLLGLQVLYLWGHPDPGWRSMIAVALTFVLGQIYLVARWTLLLTQYAAEIRLAETWRGASGRTGN